MDSVNGKGGFVQLLEAVHEVEGLRRIRFVSPHPIGFRQDLVQAFTYLPKLCSHIHFPMQSGSDRIPENDAAGRTETRPSWIFARK